MSSFFSQPFAETLPWLDATGPASDMVISTRGRLARNLSTYEFPHQANVSVRETVSAKLLKVLGGAPSLEQGWSMELASLAPGLQALLREKHLTGSKISAPDDQRHLMVNSTASISALLNGEDHLRLHACKSGFQPQPVLSALTEFEEELEGSLDFAFHDDFGYLTASPINAGTGLRLSVMVHLPGLVLGGEIDKILNALRQLRFGVRGLFGSGAAVRGAIFLISNLVTLGRDESEIASDFEFHLGKVLLHERTARQQLFANDSLGLEDLAQRSLAVLQHARLMTTQEAADRLNHLRLGIGFGMVQGINYAILNRAMVQYQSAHLEAEAGCTLSTAEKTEARANLLRDIFTGL